MTAVSKRPAVAEHWAQTYVGLPYSEYDCAQLAARVQRDIFGRDIRLPTSRGPGLRGISRQIDDLQADYAAPVIEPVEGDAVLMIGRGRINHIGVYCLIDGRPWVLHALRNVGHACLHRLRDLEGIGLHLEGFYRWR